MNVNKIWNQVNSTALLKEQENGLVNWVGQDTGILITHGIGNQLPLETLDLFARGLIKQYKKTFKTEIKLTHEIISKDANNSVPWFDNAVRIRLEGSDNFIDVYEYYWANYTEDKAGWLDIKDWLHGVVDGAGKFYSKNKALGVKYKDSSYFNVKGEFKTFRYNLFIHSISKILIAISLGLNTLLKFAAYFPFIGPLASPLLRWFVERDMSKLANVVGDIVVYNVTDPKSKFYEIKRQILDGAVHALKFLVEKSNDKNMPVYPRVILAGHSLGTQVAYDAINKLDLLVNEGQVSNYNKSGIHATTGKNIAEQLNGFITFGSPLDKIAFFLRERVPDELYLRQQLLDNYHGFKQRNWALNAGNGKDFTELPQPIRRLFDKIQWRNYFDQHDYVSGALDYYLDLENIDCHFKAGRFAFTHSDYWDNEIFYNDIIHNFLKP